MSSLARKIVVCASTDGVVIVPVVNKGLRQPQAIRIRYQDAAVSEVSRDQVPDISQDDSSFEAFGVIGMITVSRLSFLVTITKREQVAQILGYPVYAVTGVAITPCSSRDRAESSIRKTAQQLDSQLITADSESEDDLDMLGLLSDEVEDAMDAPSPTRSARNSIAEDVFRKRGSYGKFAQRWFSRDAWSRGQKSAIGLADSTSSLKSESPTESTNTTEPDRPPTTSLLPKLLHAMYFLFGTSRSFYFSYDIDLTRSVLRSPIQLPKDGPLHSVVDNMYFWNRHILSPFLDARLDAISLPLIQGFVGQKEFVADSSPPQVDELKAESLEMKPLSPRPADPETTSESTQRRPSERQYLITLISRRSTKRAGLRYLRRGINDEGFTANTVETEQILSRADWDKSKPIQSFVQMRGSIPLFWTQTAYALKPIPVLLHSEEENMKACRKHFDRIVGQYGKIQVINLVEKHGVEEPLGTRYLQTAQQIAEEVGDSKLAFEWFDFHRACRGMKFENVNELLLKVKSELEAMSSTLQVDGMVKSKQTGVFRTNCMDCLDRTNVCQSCFGKHMLEQQLKEDGIDMSAQADQETKWFNELWADNGDAVSNQYASTAAMKGDYTRTRKRDYRGALNDLGLSLTRLYSGMVNDYFSQAAIDYLLGNVTGKVFEEFEADMMTKDPAVSVTKTRERAIDLCHKRVIADLSEEVHGGWVLISPTATDTVKTQIMQEVVLLLTDAALYLCRFDWDLDKVSSFERVDLRKISNVKEGTYITSTISPAHVDEQRNVGFVVTWEPSKTDIHRTNTRTLSSRGDLTVLAHDVNTNMKSQPNAFTSFFTPIKKPEVRSRSIAFKAPYTDSSTAATEVKPTQSEEQQVATICNEIDRLALQKRNPNESKETILEKADIISLEAARRNTSVLEQIGHSLKRLVWA